MTHLALALITSVVAPWIGWCTGMASGTRRRIRNCIHAISERQNAPLVRAYAQVGFWEHAFYLMIWLDPRQLYGSGIASFMGWTVKK